MAENRGAAEKALQNPLILQNIFRKLNTTDLLDCRLVNRLNWFDLATENLCEKNQIKLDFNFSDDLATGKFCRAFENPAENPWSLKSLVNCIKQSHFFPCFRFRVSQVYFDDEDLLEFFSIHGDLILELEIDLLARTNVNSAVEKLGEILWKQLPNLQKLTIWKVSLGWSSSTRLFSKQVRATAKLQNLKYFNFETSLGNGEFKFIGDIQHAAPNLKISNVREISFVPPKIQVGSNLIFGCGIFPRLIFSPKNSNIRFYERLVRIKAKFSKIIINLDDVKKPCEIRILSRVKQILTELLKLSQSSLRELDGVVEILSSSKIPLDSFVFPNVSALQLSSLKSPVKIQRSLEKKEDKDDDRKDENSSTLNPELKSTWKISQTFPALSEVCLFSLDFLQYFQNSIQTVKILKSHAEISSAGDFQKLAKVFPKVEDLALFNIKNFQECADSLWKSFEKVKKLQIKMSVENAEDVSMDTAFVGTETFASIFELQELKTLHVTFTPTPQKPGCGSGKGKWARWNFLEKTTLIQAHQKLKQLNSISLVVDATNTDCKDNEEIHKQLEELKAFASVQVCVNQKKGRAKNKWQRRQK